MTWWGAQLVRAEKVIKAGRKWAADNRHLHLIDILAEYNEYDQRNNTKGTDAKSPGC